jgi:acyl carrier protein/acetyltransferase-like isoleucine patch superfamily enzyme
MAGNDLARAATRMVARAAEHALDDARRRFMLRAATHVGDGVRVLGRLHVACDGELVVGDRSVFISSPAPIELLVAPGGRLVLGDNVLVESGATLRARGQVIVGNAVRIGAGCVIDDDGVPSGEIMIGDGAWIEDGSVLVGGARVAPDSVLPRASIESGDGNAVLTPAPERSDVPDIAPRIRDHVRGVIGRMMPKAGWVADDAHLDGLQGWDSLAALRLLVALEKDLSIVLPHDFFSRHQSLESVVTVIAGVLSKDAA